MPRNSTMIFYGLEGTQWALAAPGGAPREAQPTRARLGLLARPGGLCSFWPIKILRKVLWHLDSV